MQKIDPEKYGIWRLVGGQNTTSAQAHAKKEGES
jgi:hypothetical protein